MRYGVNGDQFCGLSVTVFGPATYDFSASLIYFELDKQTNNKLNAYLKYFSKGTSFV